MTGIRGHAICFFRNHQARPDYDALVWRCDRCGASGSKLWMTGAWFVDDLRVRIRRAANRLLGFVRALADPRTEEGE